jgi:hypothetical protein
MQSNVIECFGTILKDDEVQPLDNVIIDDTLVFETVKPFAGYYSQMPEFTAPQTIFLAVIADYSAHKIYHLSQSIQETLGITFLAAKAQLSVNNQRFDCIRIYALDDYAHISRIQEGYQSGGVVMHEKLNYTGGPASISVEKVFILEEFKDGMYLNKSTSPKGYFELPKSLSKPQFAELLNLAKSNWTGACFDAAQGTLYRRKGIVDIVRIYTPDITKELLETIASLFIRLSEKY